MKTTIFYLSFVTFNRDVHYENFRAQCISQIAQQGLRQERGKLKRDSISSQNESITETDRLLLQKDEEVRTFEDFLKEHYSLTHFF